MKKTLTKKEIDFIENALIEKCNFQDFDDLRIELVDHIGIEIETEINENDFSFEEAFIKTMTKWNSMILPKKISKYEKVPYIVCKLWKTLDWKFQYGLIPIAILITAFLYFLNKSDFSVYSFVGLISVIGLAANFYLLYKKATNKIKSTLSMYATNKLTYLSLSLYTLIGINVFFYLDDKHFFMYPLCYGIIYYSLFMIGKSWLMQKHIEIENQLLKIS